MSDEVPSTMLIRVRVDGVRGTLVSSHTAGVAWVLATPPFLATVAMTSAILAGHFWALLLMPVIAVMALVGATVLSAGRPSNFELGSEHVVLATRRLRVVRLVHAWIGPLEEDVAIVGPPVRHLAVRLRDPDEIIRIPANWHQPDELAWLCRELNELAERDIEAADERENESQLRTDVHALKGRAS